MCESGVAPAANVRGGVGVDQVGAEAAQDHQATQPRGCAVVEFEQVSYAIEGAPGRRVIPAEPLTYHAELESDCARPKPGTSALSKPGRKQSRCPP